MFLVKLFDLFQSVKSSEAPYIYDHLTSGNTANLRMMVTQENTTEKEREIFKIFCDALSIGIEQLDNYGSASYKNGVFVYHSPVYFGKNADDELGLLIGSETFDGQYSSLFIPCVQGTKQVTKGKKTIEQASYSLNENEIELIEVIDQQTNKPTGKNYLKISTISDEGNEIDFQFPFLVDKKRQFKEGEISQLFKSGNFAEAVRQFGSGTSRIWAISNFAFRKLFEAKKFPAEGIYLLCKNGKLKFTPEGQYGFTSDCTQSDWEIVATSHPDIVVQYQGKRDELGNKQLFEIPLAEVTNINFTDAKTSNEGFSYVNTRFGVESSFSDGLRPNTDMMIDQLALIKIVSPSARNIAHSPVNTCTTLKPYMLGQLVALGNKYIQLGKKECADNVIGLIQIVNELASDREVLKMAEMNENENGNGNGVSDAWAYPSEVVVTSSDLTTLEDKMKRVQQTSDDLSLVDGF